GDSVGPSADGFETYGVTGVALITFILLGVKDPTIQVQLLVWIFVMRVMMLVSSAGSYFMNGAWAKAKYAGADEMNYETPLDTLAGFVAGNFSCYYLGGAMIVLMAIAYYVSTAGLGALMLAPAVFAFGLVAFGFLGMGPVTIAVDSYGPVTDNAQSIYELS